MTLRVFITGGASGLGREMAMLFIGRGAEVLIGDKEAGTVKAVADQIGATAIVCDVCSDEDLERTADWIRREWGGLDLLVNNAGVAQMGSLEHTSMDDWRWIMEINVLGVVRTTRTMLSLLDRGARVLNIASMAGLIGLPRASAYCTSKTAVLALSESLMLELEEHGISVHVACPAFFRTNMAKNMRAADADSARVTTRMVERARQGAPETAEAILHGLDRGDSHIFTHPGSHRTWLFKRYLPFATFLNMMRKQIKKMEKRTAPSAAAER